MKNFILRGKWKCLQPLFVCLLMFSSAAFAAAFNGITKVEEKLSLSSEIIDKKYQNRHQLRLALRLTYTNRSQHNILMYRHSSAITEARITKDCAAISCEAVKSISSNTDIYFDKAQTSLTRDDFVNLAPSESFQVDSDMIIFLDSDFASPQVEEKENYQLRILVKTLYGEAGEYRRIRKKHYRHSKIFTDDIISSPLKFAAARIGS